MCKNNPLINAVKHAFTSTMSIWSGESVLLCLLPVLLEWCTTRIFQSRFLNSVIMQSNNCFWNLSSNIILKFLYTFLNYSVNTYFSMATETSQLRLWLSKCFSNCCVNVSCRQKQVQVHVYSEYKHLNACSSNLNLPVSAPPTLFFCENCKNNILSPIPL